MREFYTDNTTYSEEAGVSVVEKSNKWGTFRGTAYCNELDNDIKNRWDGMTIADFRAEIKCRHAKAEAMRQRYVEAKHIQNILGTDNEKLNKQVEIARRNAHEARGEWKLMRSTEQSFVENVVNKRREMREKIAEKKEQ